MAQNMQTGVSLDHEITSTKTASTYRETQLKI